MFRLKNASSLVLAGFATGSLILTIAQPGISQTSKLLPCTRPSETNSWGVRIYSDKNLNIKRQTNLIAGLVSDVSGLASYRRCAWQITQNNFSSTKEGWQIEVSTELNAQNVAVAARRLGFYADVTRN